MYNRVPASGVNELATLISRRSAGRGTFFVRLCGTGAEDALWKFHEAARQKGVIIEGQIPNPDESQLIFLTERLGVEFRPEAAFIDSALGKWMPRLSSANRREFASALCAQFDEMRSKGKTDGILKNTYYKIMCWLYYKFERLVPFLGDDDPPRVLYECPSITAHELTLLRLLNMLGADILLLETAGDGGYRRFDPDNAYSQLFREYAKPFPPEFTLKTFRKMMAQKAQPAAPARVIPMQLKTTPAAPSAPAGQRAAMESRFPKPSRSACTNAWMSTPDYTAVLTPAVSRGDGLDFFFNAFIRVNGAEDRVTYQSQLFEFYQKFKATGRNIVIVDSSPEQPGPDETDKIRRRPYRSADEMIIDLAVNLPVCANQELHRQLQYAFMQVMADAAREEPALSKLVICAVYLLCRIKKYHSQLFSGFKGAEIPCFALMGGCSNIHEALYLRFLSRLPADVLIFAPDLNRPCILKDSALLDIRFSESHEIIPFPRDAGSLQMRTAAAHAEDDLTGALFTGTGLYRSHQFGKADSIVLKTTYDEIFILWSQELRFRSNFSARDNTATLPVVYAKISGIEKGNQMLYWQKMKLLMSSLTVFVNQLPMLPSVPGPFDALAVKVLRNGVIQRDALKNSREYPFNLLRGDLQEHILDKLQLMLDRRIIKGTFENGTEYTVISTVLGMKQDILRLLQSFDFTCKNPKLVVVNTGETTGGLRDAIMITFLSLVGFDVAMFVPTGYQVIENHLNDCFPVEHKLGDYVYDLQVPDFDRLPPLKTSLWDKFFRRG